MYIAPNSTVKLYGGVQIIPGRQIAFSSKANQTSYFASKLVQSDTPCTYVRRTYSVKVEVALSVVKNCNYISFVNPDFENITWYARITNYEYVNNACTEIFYAIDYFQTFMFDVNFEVCTMDREQLSVTDYDKSVANPYDYSIIEMQTDENISLPDEVFDYPAVIGQRSSNFDAKRTFLPGGGEDSSSEQIADTEMLYTIIMSTPVTDITISLDSGTGVYVMTDADGTFTYENIKSLFNNAGFDGALVNPSSDLPIGNTVKATKYEGALAGIHDKFSWVMWDTNGYYGYGSFGMFKNNVNNQTLILATNEYERMQNILRVIAENDSVSSIIGCYSLPLSFIAMLHAQSNTDALRTNFVELSDSDRGPDYWNLEDSTYNWISVFKEEVTPIGFSEVQNKKLLTFPYQYIRVTSPNGAKKEFRFEDFTEFQGISASGLNPENQFVAKFTLLADITNTPLLELYPYLYKMYNNTTATYDHLSFRKKLNVEERIEFSDYPQQAFMTDAYLAYVSNQYSNQMRNEPMRENLATQEYYNKHFEKSANWEDTTSAIDVVGGAIGKGLNVMTLGGWNAIGRATGLWSSENAGNAYHQKEMQNAQNAAALQKNEAAINLRREAQAWADTGEIGSQLSAAKPAFRMNNYVAGGGSGVLPYYLNGFKFTFDVMKLKSAFLQKLDEYFTNYGYKSTVTHVPHIATYLGGTKTGNAPKFLQNSQGYYVTYVKTVDCKVYSSMELITEFFESLFNAGIQLIDGDTLLSNNK